jgi:hypothetical protein
VESFCKALKLNLSFRYVRNFKTKRSAFKRTNRNSLDRFSGASGNGLLDWFFRSISRIFCESKLGNNMRWSWLDNCWINNNHLNSKRQLVKINCFEKICSG